ncbi:asparaginase [Amycolatopsis jiangsuensis]|uniref:L-asparaginase n=1 Tax=Amycolatopsis jiangsuensis TaxID=1181879 RepID=A0A840IVW7_9PSEU|nr:asparaginase [Amycolatopsis jiangsuensis]MBB4685477.1 L-asparaginase [Amycolatopsis jiangsuensis]
MTRARVAVAALGGTISMAPGRSPDDGVVPRLSAEDLLGGLGADLPMDVTAGTLAGLSSASMSYAKLAQTRQWGIEQIEAGAAGLVVVQGTDTLEETAYFFELTWPFDEPVVVTGAMRNPSLPSPDGPANLLTALTVAADPRSRGRGALVAFDDDVHAARWVRKAHSSHLEAFSSVPAGPLGMVAEGAVHYFHPSAPRPPALPAGEVDGLVPLLESGLADSGELLSLVLAAGARGVVLAGAGVGHVSSGTADVVQAAQVPIVVATRTGAGPTFRGTYGFHGSESSLIRMGATMAGWLCPRKSRVLLQLLLAAGTSRAEIEHQFRLRGDLDR